MGLLGPLEPYRAALGGLVALALAAALVGAGVWIGRELADDQVAKLQQAVERKNAALRVAAAALRGAGDALRHFDAESSRRIAEAKEEARVAKSAREAAVAAQARLERELAIASERWARVGRTPDCEALLNTDLQKVCGL